MVTTLGLGSEYLLSGIEFYSGIELQTAIKNYLVSVGWTVSLDNILISGELILKGVTDNDHECLVRFDSILDTDREYLRIKGECNGFLSPGLELDYDLAHINRLWIMGDNDSGGICIRNRFTYSGGISFGFLERYDESDPYAWMIAKANNRLNDAYVARSSNNIYWHKIGDSYFNADLFSSVGMNGAYQGILDYAIALPLGSFTALTVANAGFFAHIGSLNATNNKALVTRRFYLEGETAPENYSDSSEFSFRGFVKHFYNGFGSLPGGATLKDTDDNTYITTGADGWQGLKIIAESPVVTEELPVIYHDVQILNSDRALSEIKNALANFLGWVLVSDVVDSGGDRILTLRSQYFDSEQYCFLNLKSNNITNQIQIRGELREDISQAGELSQAFNFSEVTNINLSANAQALAMIVTSNGVDTSLYFGFYGGRIDLEDKYAWGIGIVGTDLNQMFVAKSKLTGEIWKSIGSQFNSSLNKRSSFPVNGIGDRLSVPLLPYDYFNNTDPRNSARKLTATSSIVDYLAIIEGRANSLDYGSSEQFTEQGRDLFYRGYVQFCCVGSSGITKTGAKFISGVQVS